MVEVIYLFPGDQLPQVADDEPWLTVEASNDGRFFGSGSSPKDGIYYVSLAENDGSLAAALAAAKKWAAERGVRRIWVQKEPW